MRSSAEARVRRICHPDLGAGGDGILLIGAGDGGGPRVRIFNPDGGEAEFSGNGTRIAAGYLMRARRRGRRRDAARSRASSAASGTTA